MSIELWPSRGYAPDTIAKVAVGVAAVGYMVLVILDGMAGADLAQMALGIAIVPLILVVLPWLTGMIAYYIGRRNQRVGDIAFSIVLFVECVYPYVASAVR